jgi:hypothetical protein
MGKDCTIKSRDQTVRVAKNIVFEARGKNQALESMARNALAALYTLRGEFFQAMNQLTVAIQIADSSRDQLSGMMFRAHLANISVRAKKFGQAEEATQDALVRAKIYVSGANASEGRQAAAEVV